MTSRTPNRLLCIRSNSEPINSTVAKITSAQLRISSSPAPPKASRLSFAFKEIEQAGKFRGLTPGFILLPAALRFSAIVELLKVTGVYSRLPQVRSEVVIAVDCVHFLRARVNYVALEVVEARVVGERHHRLRSKAVARRRVHAPSAQVDRVEVVERLHRVAAPRARRHHRHHAVHIREIKRAVIAFELDAHLPVDVDDLHNRIVQGDGVTSLEKYLESLLALAERVGEDDRLQARHESAVDMPVKLPVYLLILGEVILRPPEGALGYQDVARDDLRRLTREPRAQLEVPGVKQARAPVLDQGLGGAEAVARRVKRELVIAEIFRLVKVEHYGIRSPDPVLEELRGGGRGDDLFVTLDMIRVGVRDDGALARPLRIHPQSYVGKVNSPIVNYLQIFFSRSNYNTASGPPARLRLCLWPSGCTSRFAGRAAENRRFS